MRGSVASPLLGTLRLRTLQLLACRHERYNSGDPPGLVKWRVAQAEEVGSR